MRSLADQAPADYLGEAPGGGSMSKLQMAFEKAAEAAKKLPEKPGNDVLLQLYSLYKQGTEGDCKGARPGIFDLVGKAKYDAWAARKGTKKEDAQKAYVDLVESLQKKAKKQK
jgi:acyl-CoA-binding protein